MTGDLIHQLRNSTRGRRRSTTTLEMGSLISKLQEEAERRGTGTLAPSSYLPKKTAAQLESKKSNLPTGRLLGQ